MFDKDIDMKTDIYVNDGYLAKRDMLLTTSFENTKNGTVNATNFIYTGDELINNGSIRAVNLVAPNAGSVIGNGDFEVRNLYATKRFIDSIDSASVTNSAEISNGGVHVDLENLHTFLDNNHISLDFHDWIA